MTPPRGGSEKILPPEVLMHKAKPAALAIASLLLIMSGCGSMEKTGEGLTQWAAGRANDALETVGSSVREALNDLHDAEYQGGPFENDPDSARAYLLEEMEKKYGIEFAAAGKEELKSYGPFAGAAFTCEVAPVDAPEQAATAFVSQSMDQGVRDNYAVYFFKDEAEAPILTLCETKDYVIDQRVSLEMPETEKIWTADNGLEKFLSESGAYVKLVLRFPDGLDAETYAAYLYDFLNGVGRLHCNLLLQAKANKIYIFHKELNILDGFDAGRYTVENLKQEVEEDLSMGAPR